MTAAAKRYKLKPLAVVLLLLDLAVFTMLPHHRFPFWSALAILAGLDLVVAGAWFVAVTLAAKSRARQTEYRLEYDQESYWAKTRTDRK